jgi:uncharacterized protein YbaR (Trm112 family)
MPVEPDLLAILVCPDNHRPLRLLEAEGLRRVNERIAARSLRNRKGEVLERALAEALVREGDDLVYPVEDGIPVLLVEAGVPLD